MRNRSSRLLRVVLLALGLSACEQELIVGRWACTSAATATATADDATLDAPWSTSFEDQFCDYAEPTGFCYAEPGASYTTVTSPVHSGRFSAAFHVLAGDPNAHQTRCVRQGRLPKAAYYGAWYFVPESARATGLWNLIHFQANDRNDHGLWDVSLVNGEDGELELVVYDFLSSVTRRPARRTSIPIASWFHIELYLVRAAEPTGEVALYQDGQLLFRAENLVTDDSESGQWYVGNLASSLSPTDSTVYVDDVSIRSEH